MNFPKITLKTKFPSQMLPQSPRESLPEDSPPFWRPIAKFDFFFRGSHFQKQVGWGTWLMIPRASCGFVVARLYNWINPELWSCYIKKRRQYYHFVILVGRLHQFNNCPMYQKDQSAALKISFWNFKYLLYKLVTWPLRKHNLWPLNLFTLFY